MAALSISPWPTAVPGLPPDLAQVALFQRFIRGDKARLLRGSGLGPSLAAAVTRLHGFALSIENTDPAAAPPDEDGGLIAPPSSLQLER
jgi:signal transduction histidine kinase